MPLNPNLKTILDEAPGKCVPYAVIEGIASKINLVLHFADVHTIMIHWKIIWEKKTFLIGVNVLKCFTLFRCCALSERDLEQSVCRQL